MTLLAVLFVLLSVVSLVASLVATVRHDGYGTLEPPHSHPRDDVVLR
jgi:hypothetical protein